MSVARRRDKEREQRREAIVTAADAVFTERGFDEAKMIDIARATELGKGTLYLYFSSKEELFAAVLERHYLEVTRRVVEAGRGDGRALEGLWRVGLTYAQFIIDRPGYVRALVRLLASPDRGAAQAVLCTDACLSAAQRESATTAQLVARGIEEGSLRDDLTPVGFANLWPSLLGVSMFDPSLGVRTEAPDFCDTSLYQVLVNTFRGWATHPDEIDTLHGLADERLTTQTSSSSRT